MKILFISLGCDKNLADSEEMLGLLTGSGHEIVDSEEEADAIVINTCCFIHDAKEESVNTILEMAEYKKTRQLQSTDRNWLHGTALQRRNHTGDPGGGCHSRNHILRRHCQRH